MNAKVFAMLPWALCLVTGSAHAQDATAITEAPPGYISYQGTIYHADDSATPYDGALTLEFRLYLNATDAVETAVWAERHEGVPVFSGVFNVYLGAGGPVDGVSHTNLASVFRAQVLWLGLTVGLDDEIVPRQRITSIPYAMAAANVDTATHGVPAGTIVMFAGVTAPEGWIICNGAQLLKADYPALFRAVGATWGETATTFTLPDLRGRLPIGSGFGVNDNTDTRSGATAKLRLHPFGTTVGNDTHQLNVTEIPPHRHGYNDKSGSGSTAIVAFAWGAADENQFKDDPFTTGSAGQNRPHNTMQPTTHMHYIIKY